MEPEDDPRWAPLFRLVGLIGKITVTDFEKVNRSIDDLNNWSEMIDDPSWQSWDECYDEFKELIKKTEQFKESIVDHTNHLFFLQGFYEGRYKNDTEKGTSEL